MPLEPEEWKQAKDAAEDGERDVGEDMFGPDRLRFAGFIETQQGDIGERENEEGFSVADADRISGAEAGEGEFPCRGGFPPGAGKIESPGAEGEIGGVTHGGDAEVGESGMRGKKEDDREGEEIFEELASEKEDADEGSEKHDGTGGKCGSGTGDAIGDGSNERKADGIGGLKNPGAGLNHRFGHEDERIGIEIGGVEAGGEPFGLEHVGGFVDACAIAWKKPGPEEPRGEQQDANDPYDDKARGENDLS